MMYGPYSLAEWKTMLDLKQDNKNMTAINDGRYTLSIKRNTNCLKEFFSKQDEAA